MLKGLGAELTFRQIRRRASAAARARWATRYRSAIERLREVTLREVRS